MSTASAVVPIGYKQTEIGVIPGDWVLSTLGKISLLKSGGTPNRNVKEYWNGMIPWVTTSEVDWNVITESVQYISEKGLENSSAKFLSKGTVLMAMYGQGKTRGKVAVLDLDATTNQACAALVIDKAISNSYVFYSLVFKYFQIRNLSNTGNQENLSLALIKDIQISLPITKSEQDAIAIALSESEIHILTLQNLIAKKRDIKQGTMQGLLTGKTRLPGFSDEWKTAKLKDFLKTPVTDGPHLTPIFHRTGIPFLSVNNLVNNRINFSELRYISNEDHIEFSKKCKPERNDILLGKAASVGKVAIIDFDLELNIWSPLALIRVNKKHNSKFVFYSFQSRNILYQIELLTNSSSQGNIGMGDIELLIFNLPEKDEQIAIAEILSDMDAEITALEERLEKAKAIKQGMMQQLLTGKIRLVEPQTSQEVSA